MSISIAVLRTQKTRLLIALAFVVVGCDLFRRVPRTYTVTLQEESLPPGVSPNPSQFRAQSITGRPEGAAHVHSRPGIDCSGCHVDVEIRSLGETRDVNPSPPPSAPLPETGRAVARIRNLDPARIEEMYRFRPSSQFEYYVWADTVGTPARARMTLLEVPAPGSMGNVRAVFRKPLQLCAHDAVAPAYSDADFRFCEGVHLSLGRKANYAAMFPLAPFSALLSRVIEFAKPSAATELPPIWLRCRDGCCG